MSNTATLQTLDRQYIMTTYDRYPIALAKGKGVKVWDVNSKEYLDFLGGIAVNVLGHCHPAVVQAIIKQAETLTHTSNLYYTEPAIQLAKVLVENGGLDKIFFCNSGTEANEAAIKLARKYQWRQGKAEKNQIIALKNSFHGRTLGALAATGKPSIQVGFEPLPQGFIHIEANNLTELQQVMNPQVAAMIVEPIQGEGGIQALTTEFLQAARHACDKFDAVLIFDEIQCGVGRTGTLFAYQQSGIKPDIITLAKGIANGLPLGAVCATDNIAQGFQFGDHGSTFGGNLVAAAAALATLQCIVQENLLSHIRQMSDYFWQQLEILNNDFPQSINAITGQGLMLGIHFNFDAKKILNQCHQNGLLANVCGNNVLRLLPPYIIGKTDIDAAISILRGAIEFVTKQAVAGIA